MSYSDRFERTGADRWVHLDVRRIIRETDAAFLVLIPSDEYDGDPETALACDCDEVWLPKSQISEPDDYAAGDENLTISVTAWIAEQKGLG
jgi:hypothetical protein